jgi:hypothetical protein
MRHFSQIYLTSLFKLKRCFVHLLRARPKRRASWKFQTLDTPSHQIIQRANRLIRPRGALTFSMSENAAVRKDLWHFLEAVKKAA